MSYKTCIRCEKGYQSTKSNLWNDPVIFNLNYGSAGRVDCRQAFGRMVLFESLSNGNLQRQLISDFPPTLITNTLVFGALTYHRAIKRLLLSISSKVDIPVILHLHLNFLCEILLSNRLIYEHLLKERRYGLWKPLLAALLKALCHRRVMNFEDAAYQAMLVAIQHLEADQFVFALQKGLFDFATPYGYVEDESSDEADVETSQNLGMAMIVTATYYRTKLDLSKFLDRPHTDKRVADVLDFMEDYMSDLPEEPSCSERDKQRHPLLRMKAFRQHVRFEQFSRNICGWPPCSEKMEDEGYRCKRRVWKCKRCQLIKYCCRNHQKKHWKLIHSQQCRKYID